MSQQQENPPGVPDPSDDEQPRERVPAGSAAVDRNGAASSEAIQDGVRRQPRAPAPQAEASRRETSSTGVCLRVACAVSVFAHAQVVRKAPQNGSSRLLGTVQRKVFQRGRTREGFDSGCRDGIVVLTPEAVEQGARLVRSDAELCKRIDEKWADSFPNEAPGEEDPKQQRTRAENAAATLAFTNNKAASSGQTCADASGPTPVQSSTTTGAAVRWEDLSSLQLVRAALSNIGRGTVRGQPLLRLLLLTATSFAPPDGDWTGCLVRPSASNGDMELRDLREAVDADRLSEEQARLVAHDLSNKATPAVRLEAQDAAAVALEQRAWPHTETVEAATSKHRTGERTYHSFECCWPCAHLRLGEACWAYLPGSTTTSSSSSSSREGCSPAVPSSSSSSAVDPLQRVAVIPFTLSALHNSGQPPHKFPHSMVSLACLWAIHPDTPAHLLHPHPATPRVFHSEAAAGSQATWPSFSSSSSSSSSQAAVKTVSAVSKPFVLQSSNPKPRHVSPWNNKKLGRLPSTPCPGSDVLCRAKGERVTRQAVHQVHASRAQTYAEEQALLHWAHSSFMLRVRAMKMLGPPGDDAGAVPDRSMGASRGKRACPGSRTRSQSQTALGKAQAIQDDASKDDEEVQEDEVEKHSCDAVRGNGVEEQGHSAAIRHDKGSGRPLAPDFRGASALAAPVMDPLGAMSLAPPSKRAKEPMMPLDDASSSLQQWQQQRWLQQLQQQSQQQELERFLDAASVLASLKECRPPQQEVPATATTPPQTPPPTPSVTARPTAWGALGAMPAALPHPALPSFPPVTSQASSAAPPPALQVQTCPFPFHPEQVASGMLAYHAHPEPALTFTPTSSSAHAAAVVHEPTAWPAVPPNGYTLRIGQSLLPPAHFPAPFGAAGGFLMGLPSASYHAQHLPPPQLPQTSHQLPQTPHQLPQTSHQLPQTPHLPSQQLPQTPHQPPHLPLPQLPQTSHQLPQTSHQLPQTSHQLPQTSHQLLHTPHQLPQTPHLPPPQLLHTSHQLPQTSHQLLQTTHLPHHPLLQHTSPSMCSYLHVPAALPGGSSQPSHPQGQAPTAVASLTPHPSPDSAPNGGEQQPNP